MPILLSYPSSSIAVAHCTPGQPAIFSMLSMQQRDDRGIWLCHVPGLAALGVGERICCFFRRRVVATQGKAGKIVIVRAHR